MNFAVVGLAYSHPYTYTQILQRTGHRVTHVWDDDPGRLAEFAARFGVTPVESPEAVPEGGVDGVILTGRLPERIDHARLFIQRGMPIYLGKPMAATAKQLDVLGAALKDSDTPLLATSVLRYAPALRSLRRHLDEGRLGTLVAVRAVSAHSIAGYLHEPNVWQDDPRRGGGTIVTMGVHALDMLSVLVGYHIRSIGCRAGRRFHTESRSEDTALLTLEWADGLLGTVEIVGGINAEYYGVELYGSSMVLRSFIPRAHVQDHRGTALGDPDPWEEFGYAGTMAAFVEMCRTRRMPVPLEESFAIARVLVTARESSGSGQPVQIEGVC